MKKILFFVGRMSFGGAEKQAALNSNIINSVEGCTVTFVTYGQELCDFPYRSIINSEIICLNKKVGVFGSVVLLVRLFFLIFRCKPHCIVSFLAVPSLYVTILKPFFGFKFFPSFRSSVDLNDELWSKDRECLQKNIVWYLCCATRHARIWIPLTNLIVFFSDKTLINSANSISDYKSFLLRSLQSRLTLYPNVKPKAVSERKVTSNHHLKNFLIGSRIEPRKRVNEFLTVFGAFVSERDLDWRISIYGAGSGSYFSKFQKICEYYSFVDYCGVSDSIFSELEKNDVLVVPTDWNEGFSNILVEGVEAGCVIFCSEKADTQDVLTDLVDCIKFNWSEATSIEDALRNLIIYFESLQKQAPTIKNKIEQYVVDEDQVINIVERAGVI
jgi:glycosyltransferase involved in cell wall biosynthesis